MAYGKLYLANNGGRLFAIDAKTGKVAWDKRSNHCTAAAPTVADGVIYQPFMDAKPCGEPRDSPGFIAAYDARTSRELWRFEAGVIETSPLLVGKLLYFGSWDKKMYAVDVDTHKVVWSFTTGDEIKGAPAYQRRDALLRVLRQQGLRSRCAHREAPVVRERDGQLLCHPDARLRPRLHREHGRARVRLRRRERPPPVGEGNGWVRLLLRSRLAPDGLRRLLQQALPRARRRLGRRDLVFPRQRADLGCPTVLDGVVYFSTTEGKTYGLDAESGKKLWEFDDGKYSPIVADEERVYLTGYKTLYGLVPSG